MTKKKKQNHCFNEDDYFERKIKKTHKREREEDINKLLDSYLNNRYSKTVDNCKDEVLYNGHDI